MVAAFILIHLAATILLLLSIFGSTIFYQIQRNTDFFLTMAIGLCFIVAAIKLCLISWPYFLFFGILVALITGLVVFTSPTMRFPSKLLTWLFSFLLWPEYVCLAIFALQHLNEYREYDGK